MATQDPSVEYLQKLVGELEFLQPHGWPDPDLVIKPPFHPALVTMPSGWSWGQSTLGDAEDTLQVMESETMKPAMMASE